VISRLRAKIHPLASAPLLARLAFYFDQKMDGWRKHFGVFAIVVFATAGVNSALAQPAN